MPPESSAGRVRACVLAAFVVAAGLALCGAASRVHAAPPAARGDEANQLVYLLEYVGTDYENAVRDGTVVNEFEYGEVLRFLKQVIRAYGARPERSKEVVSGLADLQKAMERKAPADQVFAASREILPELARSVGGNALPATPPNLAGGRRLYESDCAPCHGESGAGDGRASADMEPPPVAFRGTYMDRLSPRQAYNAITLGIEGTAMPSFAGAYSAQQRWDVAFYLMTLRVGFAPKRPPAAPSLTLEDLSTGSNDELLARLRQERADASAEEVDHLRANLGPLRAASAGGTASAGAATSAGGAAAGGAASGDAMAAALQLQDAFSGVAERVFPRVVGLTGFVRDPTWTVERLSAERGPSWAAANFNQLRYPGFRPVRTGSGFLADDEGFVLTRDQLLRDDFGAVVALVDVELDDQSHLPARVVGSEPALDLGVVRVADPATVAALAPLEIGDSDRLLPGHWLIALGDPPGAEKSLLIGVASAAPLRECYQQELSATRVQSSLIIPERARGGPVVDIGGRVVGLSVGESSAAVQAATDGVGRANGHVLPINLVLNLLEALKVAQSTRSPWIGISVLELERVRAQHDPEKPAPPLPPSGVGIDDVFSPSPAAAADVRPGDFLLSLGGHPIASVADFQKWMYVLGIGTKVELGLLRDGKPVSVTVTIEPRPAEASTS